MLRRSKAHWASSSKSSPKESPSSSQKKNQRDAATPQKIFVLELVGTDMIMGKIMGKRSTSTNSTNSGSPRRSTTTGLGRFFRAEASTTTTTALVFQVCIASTGAVLARSQVGVANNKTKKKDNASASSDFQWPAVQMNWALLAAACRNAYRGSSEQDDDDDEESDSYFDNDDREAIVWDTLLRIQFYYDDQEAETMTNDAVGQVTTTLRRLVQKADKLHATTLKNNNIKMGNLKKREAPCFLIHKNDETPWSMGHLHVKCAQISHGVPDIIVQDGGFQQSSSVMQQSTTPKGSGAFPVEPKEEEESSKPRALDFNAAAAPTVGVTTETNTVITETTTPTKDSPAAAIAVSSPDKDDDPEKEAWRIAKQMQRQRLEEAKRTVRESQKARAAFAAQRAGGAEPSKESTLSSSSPPQAVTAAVAAKPKQLSPQKHQEAARLLVEKTRKQTEALRAVKLAQADKKEAERLTQQQQQSIQKQRAEAQARAAALYEKLTEIPVPEEARIQEIFETVDSNHNGTLSRKEVEKAIIQRQAQFALPPTIIMRAFEKADGNRDGSIDRDEFFYFVRCITYFRNLLAIFEEMDQDGNRRLGREEFVQAAHVLNVDASHAQEVFDEMDENKGGYIVFDEFCLWMADKRALEDVAQQAQVPEQTSARLAVTPDAPETTVKSLNFDAIAGAAVLVDYSEEDKQKDIAADKAATARAEAKRLEEERVGAAKAQAEKTRLEKERIAAEKAAVAEAKQLEEIRKAEAEAAAKAEAERLEEDRIAAEKAAEAEAKRQEAIQRAEAEAAAKAEAKRLEDERTAAAKAAEAAAEAKRIEHEKLAAEKAVAAAAAEAEAKRLEAERIEAEKVAAEEETLRLEEERLAAQKDEAEALAKRVGKARLATQAKRQEEEERLAAERLAKNERLEEEKLVAEAKRKEERFADEERQREFQRLALEAKGIRAVEDMTERAHRAQEEQAAHRMAESDEEELLKWEEEADAEELAVQADQEDLDILDDLDALLADDVDMEAAKPGKPVRTGIVAPKFHSKPARRSAPAAMDRSPSTKPASTPTRPRAFPTTSRIAKSASPPGRTKSGSSSLSPSFPAGMIMMTPRELAAKEKAEQRLLNARISHRDATAVPPCYRSRSVSPEPMALFDERPARSEDSNVFKRLYKNDVPAYMGKRINPRYYESSSCSDKE